MRNRGENQQKKNPHKILTNQPSSQYSIEKIYIYIFQKPKKHAEKNTRHHLQAHKTTNWQLTKKIIETKPKQEGDDKSSGRTQRDRWKKKKKKTWSPAREEREVGFFLSLSLSLDAGVFPVNNPFAPFPDIPILYTDLTIHKTKKSKFRSKEEKKTEDNRDETWQQSRVFSLSTKRVMFGLGFSRLLMAFRLLYIFTYGPKCSTEFITTYQSAQITVKAFWAYYYG